MEETCTEGESLFKKVLITEHMKLPPSYLGRIGTGVIENLNQRILKFSGEYQGFILAYSKPRVLHTAASIHDELPNLHFDVQVEMFLFVPRVGSVLCGTVNKLIGAELVGCLVYNCFNASVNLIKTGKRRGPDSGRALGEKINFKVSSLERVSGVLCIRGEEMETLEEEDSETIDHIMKGTPLKLELAEGGTNEVKLSKKQKKKKKDKILDDSSNLQQSETSTISINNVNTQNHDVREEVKLANSVDSLKKRSKSDSSEQASLSTPKKKRKLKPN